MTNTEAEPRGERRRLAAILVADVVGYSSLMERDEDGTQRRIRMWRDEVMAPLVARHHGRVVKTMGDGVLVEFASAVDATRAALDWQSAAANSAGGLQFRIGLNVGDVIVEEEDVFGTGVNVATRLEQAADPGGICISAAMLGHIRGRVEIEAIDLGAMQLKNIRAPVQVFAIARRSSVTGQDALSVMQLRQPRPPLDLPPHPVLAVLPFLSMTRVADQDYFADGLSEDLITALSYLRGLTVLSRTSSFAFRDRSITATEVANRLGAGYVLEGSVRSSGDRLRVTAQLIDALTGAHVWAERYDRLLSDVFAIQDEIAQAIVLAMQVQLSDGELAHSPGGTGKYEAWAAFHQGVIAHLTYTAEDNLRARRLYARAAALDPEFVDARVFGAWTHWQHARSGFSKDRAADFAECRSVVKELHNRGVDTANLRHLDAVTRLMEGDYDTAISTAQAAVRAGKSRLFGNTPAAIVFIYCRRYDAAIDVLRETIRSVPATPNDTIYNLAMVSSLTGAHERAIALAEEYKRRVQGDLYGWTTLAFAYGAAGVTDRARETMLEFRELYPDYRLSDFAAHEPFRDPRTLDSVLAVMRAAGLPD